MHIVNFVKLNALKVELKSNFSSHVLNFFKHDD